MAEVKFENVDKVFDNGVKAVAGLSLDIRDGEFLVLVGPSGCGKTTALRMVAGLEAISAGTVAIGGTVVNDLTSKDRDIAMVFQNYALYPHLSVADNIAFGLRLRKEPKEKIAKQVEWAASLLDLVPYLNRRPKELSGGQRQRVAMGRAIVREPKVFLMDEPLSNLDAKLRVQMRAEIANLQKQLGTTTIYVTHDQVEAMTMGDRVAVMSMGILQQVAEPQVLYDAPSNVFVAGFIGTPPMNLFEARIERDGDYVAVVLAGTRIPMPKDRDWRYPRLVEYVGKQIVLGVRAEDVYAAETKPGWPSIKGRLGLLEALGSSQIGYLHIDA
ncbi:MAG: ABC transporter ATP-binding protein, partial [Actinomycetota bacterium]